MGKDACLHVFVCPHSSAVQSFFVAFVTFCEDQAATYTELLQEQTEKTEMEPLINTHEH